MSLKYYMDPGSGSCRRVSAVIKHLKIDVEEIFVDLLAGENRKDDFLAINPNGMLPVLVISNPGEGTIVLSEAAAIVIYLCEMAGDTKLLPVGPQRHQVLRWMFWAAEHFRQPAPMYFEERVIAPLMGMKENHHRIADADRLLNIHGPVLDAHLHNREYVIGDEVSLADFDLAAPLSQMPRSKVPYDKFPNIMRWANNLEENVEAWRDTGIALNKRMEAALKG